MNTPAIATTPALTPPAGAAPAQPARAVTGAAAAEASAVAAPAAGTSPAAAAAAPAAPAAAPDAAPAAAPPGTELSLIQRAVARISGIPTGTALHAQVAALTGERDAARAQVATLTAERDAARAAVARHEADLVALRDALDAPVAAGAQQMQTPAGQAAAAAVSQQVGAHLRALSHPAANLPAKPVAGTDPAATAPDNLREAFRAETDPVKKAALFGQLKRADEAAAARAN